MTSHEAQDQISAAMEQLKTLRDAIGAQLAKPGVDMASCDGETHRLSDLHDRLARAIQAYY